MSTARVASKVLLLCAVAGASLGALRVVSAGDAASALLTAVASGDESAVRAALRKGEDPDLADRGVTPLAAAAAKSPAGVVRALLEGGAAPEARVPGGTPLLVAAASGNVAAVEALLEFGADVDARGDRNETALHWATAAKSVVCVRALLEAGADPDAVDRDGHVPLHLASGARAQEVAGLLLDAGASPSAKDARGRDVETRARAMRETGVLEAIERRGRVGPARDVALAPGADLTKASTDAADGARLVLAAGSYAGTIAVRGKTLTVASAPGAAVVLTGGTQPPVVFVGEGGTLTLVGVAIRPKGAATHGIVVQGSEARVRDVVVEGTKASAAVVQGGGTLSWIGGAARRCGDTCVVAFDRSVVAVRDVVFADGSKGGVHVQGAKSATVTGCAFEGVVPAVSVVEGAPRVRVRRNSVTAPPRAQRAYGIAIQSDADAVVSANRIADCEIALLAQVGASARVVFASNVLLRGQVGIQVEGPKAGEPARVRTAGNSIAGAARTGVILFHRVACTSTRESWVAASDQGIALHLGTEATADVRRSLLAGPRASVAVSESAGGGARGVLHDVVVAGRFGTDDARDVSLDDASRRSTAAAEGSPAGAALGRALDGLRAAVGKVALAAPVELPGALWAVAVATRGVRERGRALAGLGVEVADRFGRVHPVGFAVYTATGAAPGAVELTPEQVRDPRGLAARLLAGKTPLAAAILAALPDRTRALASDPAAPESALGAALAAALEEQRTAKDLVGAKSALLAGVELGTAADAALRATSPDPSRRGRLQRLVLEDAFPTHVVRSAQPVATGGAGETLLLAAGSYWVVPEVRHLGAARATVADGATRVVRIDDRAGLWLEIERAESDPARILFAPQDGDVIARTIVGFDGPGASTSRASARPEASRADVEEALALAREMLANPRGVFVPPEKGWTAEDAPAGSLSWLARSAVERILWVHGVREDGERVIAHVRRFAGDSGYTKRRWIEVLAHLDARLGHLEDGWTASLLSDPDPAIARSAADALADRGGRAGRDRLFALWTSGDADSAYAASWASLGDRSPKVLDAMRALARNAKGSWYPPGALLHLLLFGSEEDRRFVTGRTLAPAHGPWLAAVARDPRPFVTSSAESAFHESSPRWLALTRFHDPVEREAFADFVEADLRRSSWSRAVKEKVADVAKQVNTDVHAFRTLSFPFRPRSEVASAVFDYSVIFPGGSWTARPDRAGDVLDAIASGRFDADASIGLLDAAPDATVEAALEARGAKWSEGVRRLVRASHRATTGWAFLSPAAVRDGADRRAFAFRKEVDHGGALVGVVEARAGLTDGTLDLSLRVRQTHHWHTSNWISGGEGFGASPMRPYVLDGGRKVMRSVRLRRGTETLPLERVEATADGAVLHRATPGPSGLAGLELEVELEFLGETRTVVFELYDGEAGRRARLRAARPDVVAAAGTEAVAREEAARLSEAGRIADARAAIERALASPDASADAWFDAAAIAFQGDRPADAAAACRETLARDPRRADARTLLALSLWLAGDPAADAALAEAAGSGRGGGAVALAWLASRAAGAPPALAQAEERLKAVHAASADSIERDAIGVALGVVRLDQALPAYLGDRERSLLHAAAGVGAVARGGRRSAGPELEAAVATGRPSHAGRRIAARVLASLPKEGR